MPDQPIDGLDLAQVLKDLQFFGIKDTASLGQDANQALVQAMRCQIPAALNASAQTYKGFERVFVLLEEKWGQGINAEDFEQVQQVSELVTKVKEAQLQWQASLSLQVSNNCECNLIRTS